MNVSDFELGWLSGIIDGEGSITVMKRGSTYVPSLKMSNTSKLLIDKYCNILDSYEITYQCYGRQKCGDRKYQWEVCIEGRPRVYKALMFVRDLLIAKQRQADKVIEWIESRGLDLRGPYTDSQMQIINDVRKLNGRGRAFSECTPDIQGRVR